MVTDIPDSKEKLLNEQECEQQNIQYERMAKRILKAVIKSLPSIIPKLKLKGSSLKINNQVDMPLLGEYSGLVIPSYIIVRGEKTRILYLCIMKELLFEKIKKLLIYDTEIREELTKQTFKIQFACPDLGVGLYFKEKSQGLFKKKVGVYQFKLRD